MDPIMTFIPINMHRSYAIITLWTLACSPSLGDAVSLGETSEAQGSTSAADPTTGEVVTSDASSGAECVVGPDCTDDDGDGYSEKDGDCADANHLIHPAASEICDLLDNNCNGENNEGLACSGKIFTIAGTGETKSPPGDGIPAVSAPLGLGGPIRVHMAIDGTIYLAADGVAQVNVSSIDPDGVLRTVVTGNPKCFPLDEVPAVQGCVRSARGIGTDMMGNVYIADSDLNTVWQVDAAGVLRRFAGSGSGESSGDGGLALFAGIPRPVAVTRAQDDSMLIAEFSGGSIAAKVRKVGPDGTITTVAGGGVSTEEGALATESRILEIVDMFVDEFGVLFLAGEGVYMIDTDGRRWTMLPSYANALTGVADGTLYLMHPLCQIQKFGVDMAPEAYVGQGVCGFKGDGEPALAALLNYEFLGGLAPTPEGDLILTDERNGRIRMVFR